MRSTTATVPIGHCYRLSQELQYITGEQIRDRVAKHALCDEILIPAVRNYLIYDNSASQVGKGIDFARRRLLTHLRKYYHQHQSNEGYILLIDFSKYYDNIRHDVLMEQFEKYVHDERALSFLRQVIDRSKIDVSYMTDEEYAGCMDRVFNSLEYQEVDRSLLTGEKFMYKHLNIGGAKFQREAEALRPTGSNSIEQKISKSNAMTLARKIIAKSAYNKLFFAFQNLAGASYSSFLCKNTTPTLYQYRCL